MIEQKYPSNTWINTGAILFGIFLGLFIVDSIRAGASKIFPEESKYWATGFWEDRFILRIIASIIGTVIGAFAAGNIAKSKGALCGLISTIPTSIFWIVVVIMLIFAPPESASLCHWGVSLFLIIISPLLGFYNGNMGHIFRKDYTHIFIFRSRSVLGIKWFHWLWLIFPLYQVLQSITAKIWLSFNLFFGSTQIIITSHSILYFILAVVVLTCIYFMGFGIFKTFYFLSMAYRLKLSKFQIVLRLLFYIVAIPLLSDLLINSLAKLIQLFWS